MWVGISSHLDNDWGRRTVSRAVGQKWLVVMVEYGMWGEAREAWLAACRGNGEKGPSKVPHPGPQLQPTEFPAPEQYLILTLALVCVWGLLRGG